jgi:hypothetical protein
MMLMRASREGAWMGLTAAAGVVSWQAAGMTLAALIASGVLRLLAEWQRRKTLSVLIAHAPEGTQLTQQDTPPGQFMQVRLGPSSRQLFIRP